MKVDSNSKLSMSNNDVFETGSRDRVAAGASERGWAPEWLNFSGGRN